MTERLTFDEAVAWMYPRTSHFTDGPSREILLLLTDSLPEFRTLAWTTPHAGTATIAYDAGDGFYWCGERGVQDKGESSRSVGDLTEQLAFDNRTRTHLAIAHDVRTHGASPEEVLAMLDRAHPDGKCS